MAFTGSTLPLARWGPDHVHDWLVSEGFVNHAKVFHRQHVDGRTLAGLQFKDLAEELDVVNMAEQNQLWTAIQALRARDIRIHAPYLLQNASPYLLSLATSSPGTLPSPVSYVSPPGSLSMKSDALGKSSGVAHTGQLDALDTWLGINNKPVSTSPPSTKTTNGGSLDSPAVLSPTVIEHHSSTTYHLGGDSPGSVSIPQRPTPITQMDLLWGRQPPGYPMLSQAMQNADTRSIQDQLRDLRLEANALAQLASEAEDNASRMEAYNSPQTPGRANGPLSPISPQKPMQYAYYTMARVGSAKAQPRAESHPPPPSARGAIWPSTSTITAHSMMMVSTPRSSVAPPAPSNAGGTLDEALNELAREYDDRTRQLRRRVNYQELVRRQSMELSRGLGL